MAHKEKVFCSNCKYFKDNSSYNDKYSAPSECTHPLNYKIVETPLHAKMVQRVQPEKRNIVNCCEDYEPSLMTQLTKRWNSFWEPIKKKLGEKE